MSFRYNDKELIALLQNGSETEIEKAALSLVKDKSLQRKVYSVIRNRLKNKAYADDVFNESIWVAILGIQEEKFSGKTPVHNYIVGICRNKCNEFNGRRKYAQSGNNLEDIYISSNYNNIEEQLITAETAALLRKYIKKLTPNCQKHLIARYWEEKSAKDVAIFSQKKEQSIHNQVSRCRKALRVLLSKSVEVMAVVKAII